MWPICLRGLSRDHTKGSLLPDEMPIDGDLYVTGISQRWISGELDLDDGRSEVDQWSLDDFKPAEVRSNQLSSLVKRKQTTVYL